MAMDTMFSGESQNVEYKIALPDKSEKYMKKKALYTGALHEFGREDGRVIYQLLKNTVEEKRSDI